MSTTSGTEATLSRRDRLRAATETEIKEVARRRLVESDGADLSLRFLESNNRNEYDNIFEASQLPYGDTWLQNISLKGTLPVTGFWVSHLALGLSIDDSRMAVLGGEFAVLMSVAGDDDALAELDQRLTELAEASDFAYLFRRTVERTTARNLPYQVRVVAMDHPGIVHGIASFFSARDINIRELETETEHAPHTGTPIFKLVMTVEVPQGTKVAQLKNEFAAFCEERDLDGTLNVPL